MKHIDWILTLYIALIVGLILSSGCSTTGKVEPYQIDPKNVDLFEIRRWIEDVFEANDLPAPADIEEIIPTNAPPVIVPEEPSDPPAEGITLKWDKGGVNAKGATYDERAVLSNVKWSTSQITYTVDISHWPLTGQKDTRSICCLFILGDDGKYHGGKFDWARTGRNQTRHWKPNVWPSNYGGHRRPQSGDQVAFCLITKDAKRISSIATWTWP